MGEITAVDTATELTAQGSVTTANRRPAKGTSKIDRIVVGATGDHAVDGGATIFLRLPGAGIKGGAQTIMVGATGGELTAAADHTAGQMHRTIENVDIPITGDDIEIRAEMAGVDPGTVSIGITLYLA